MQVSLMKIRNEEKKEQDNIKAIFPIPELFFQLLNKLCNLY
jgi:hypothetical protein